MLKNLRKGWSKESEHYFHHCIKLNPFSDTEYFNITSFIWLLKTLNSVIQTKDTFALRFLTASFKHTYDIDGEIRSY